MSELQRGKIALLVGRIAGLRSTLETICEIEAKVGKGARVDVLAAIARGSLEMDDIAAAAHAKEMGE